MNNAKLAMAFHCYQPVDNFEREFERAYNTAYLPLLKTLEGFPGIKASFHYSGNLLEWFEQRHPQYIEKVKALVRRRQIELIGGGFYEPVMALIPERDREEQIRMNDEIIGRIFGVKPRGVWIAEKVWEPDLADTLIRAGAKYTIIDDYHLLQAGVEEEKIFSPCLTRGKNGSVTLFPSLTRLRYTMPFRLPKITIDYIKRMTNKNADDVSCFFFADDGEKFGLWPHTYRWVHRKGWLRNFFLLLEKNSDWLRTATYSEVMDTVLPRDVAEVPESTYAEMTEWSGGNFKNFLKKYPEAHRMHKRMISVSDMIDRIRSGDNRSAADNSIEEAKKELFKAQSSCAYWHGTFGGLYFPHLRDGVYRHLIKAQNIIDKMKLDDLGDKYVRSIERDLGQGRSETVIRNRYIDVFVKSFDGGAVSELDYKPLSVNLTNTMSRVKESYHKKLQRGGSTRAKQARKAIMCGDFADVHDALGVGEKGLRRILFYDDYQRSSFLTHIFRDRRPWKDMYRGSAGHDGFLKGLYSFGIRNEGEYIIRALTRRDKVFVDNGRPFDLEVNKEIKVGSGPAVIFSHKIIKHSGDPGPLRYALEFNFSICDRAVMSRPKLARTDRFTVNDKFSGLSLNLTLNREFTVFMYPVFTVNETESGLKKTFQGVSVIIGDEIPSDTDGTADDMNLTIEIG